MIKDKHLFASPFSCHGVVPNALPTEMAIHHNVVRYEHYQFLKYAAPCRLANQILPERLLVCLHGGVRAGQGVWRGTRVTLGYVAFAPFNLIPLVNGLS